MSISTFDLFKIGIGPSSSHTVGPMRAAQCFASRLQATGVLPQVARLRCGLYGSLGATGKGHGSDRAVVLGLEGEQPDLIDPDVIESRVARVREHKSLNLAGETAVHFAINDDLVFYRRETLPFHPNGLRLQAFDATGQVLLTNTFYSVGGGFVLEPDANGEMHWAAEQRALPHPFRTGAELLQHCREQGRSVAQIMWANELAWHDAPTVRTQLLRLASVMEDCVNRGLRSEGVLPGGFKVKRRAAPLHRDLLSKPERGLTDPLQVLDWVNLFALAVSEENAAGGRVVTAPTNGAAGIIPAVLRYYQRFVPGAHEQGVVDFLLTAAAVGILYKHNASISGAEVGCQGEVGVACSMAAAALCAVLGGSPEQVENAAEIGMEHHLGLTCDPVGGLVQIPCIERNAIASVKAINAARMALRGDGSHFVSLDQVIKTMRETGADMKSKYKETARGGLAVNIVEC
jgi:L-serine dehydratase